MSFPEPTAPTPAESRREPTIWFQRIVIAKDFSSTMNPIREIPFRRGLNIIRTEVRNEKDVRTVGHSVGKTLLVRLLRYCLGERTFGTETQVKAVQQAYEAGWVFAVIHLDGQPWTVARPLGLQGPDGYSARGENLGLLLRESSERLSFKEFLHSIETVSSRAFNDLYLPNTSPPRHARWMDLLAWVARDQNCRYRHHHEWRDPDSKSGTGQLTLEGAGMLIRMVLDLFAKDEHDVIRKHRQLLDKKSELEDEQKGLLQFHSVGTETLGREFAIDGKQGEEGLFARGVAQAATEKRNELKRLLADIQKDPKKNDAWNALLKAGSAFSAAEGEAGAVRGRFNAKQLDLASRRADLERNQHEQIEALGLPFCKFFDTQGEAFDGGCPGKVATPDEESHPSPLLLAEIQRLEGELQKLEDQLGHAFERREDLRKELGKAQADYQSAVEDQAGHIQKISVKIGRQGELRRLALRTEKSRKRYRDLTKEIEDAEKDVEKSLQLQAKLRSQLDARKAKLSGYFALALKRLVSPDAEGSLVLDAKGVRPSPSEDIPTGGEAITTSATVLSFDLACLIASVCGLGHFPGLLIHDSPREADMEPQMYHALFNFIIEMESWYGEREPGFQYIVTTTTPPPENIKSVYVRETLHGRQDDGLLFRKRL